MNSTLKRCLDAFKVARMTVVDAIEKLYVVYKEDSWKGVYSSWSEFCEDGLQISRSLGSQYVQVYEHYIEKGGMSAKHLGEVDTHKLYMLIGSKGTPEEKLATAKTLSRAEIRENKNDISPHTHDWIEICSICHARHQL